MMPCSTSEILILRDGHPGGQTVTAQWRLDWDTYISSKLGYVILYMDVSGSGFSGDSCRKSVEGQLGVRETRDILEVVR